MLGKRNRDGVGGFAKADKCYLFVVYTKTMKVECGCRQSRFSWALTQTQDVNFALLLTISD